MSPVCAPTKAAVLAGGAGVAVVTVAVVPDVLVALLVVLSVVAAAGVALFVHLVRQPLQPSKPRRAPLSSPVLSYRLRAEKPSAAISARRVIPGVVIGSEAAERR